MNMFKKLMKKKNMKNISNTEYTYEEMRKFFVIYSSGQYRNRLSFIKTMKKLKVPKEDAVIIWQSFDMATEQFLFFLKALEENVWYPSNTQIL